MSARADKAKLALEAAVQEWVAVQYEDGSWSDDEGPNEADGPPITVGWLVVAASVTSGGLARGEGETLHRVSPDSQLRTTDWGLAHWSMRD